VRGPEGEGLLQDNGARGRLMELQSQRQIAGEQAEAERDAVQLGTCAVKGTLSIRGGRTPPVA
jgi:hypothetical protein